MANREIAVDCAGGSIFIKLQNTVQYILYGYMGKKQPDLIIFFFNIPSKKNIGLEWHEDE